MVDELLGVLDVTLATEDNQQIKAHKVILSSYTSFSMNILLNNPHHLLYIKVIRHRELKIMEIYLVSIKCGMETSLPPSLGSSRTHHKDVMKRSRKCDENVMKM